MTAPALPRLTRCEQTRLGAASLPPGSVSYDARERIRQVQADCRAARYGVGPAGNFMMDFHQRFTFADALRGCTEGVR